MSAGLRGAQAPAHARSSGRSLCVRRISLANRPSSAHSTGIFWPMYCSMLSRENTYSSQARLRPSRPRRPGRCGRCGGHSPLRPGEVVVEHVGHVLHIDSPARHVGRDQDREPPFLEVPRILSRFFCSMSPVMAWAFQLLRFRRSTTMSAARRVFTKMRARAGASLARRPRSSDTFSCLPHGRAPALLSRQ